MNPVPVRFGERGSGLGGPGRFGRLGAGLGLGAVIALVAGMIWSAAAGSTLPDRHASLFESSLVLEDYRPLPVVDLATARVTVRLPGINDQVGASSYGDVQTVPVDGGTFLVNRRSGSFNLLGRDDYVLDPAGAGIGLGPLPGSTGARGLAAGSGAYIVRYGPHSTVSLVDPSTVTAGARSARAGSGAGPSVTPRGFSSLAAPAFGGDSAAAVAGGDLWVLTSSQHACDVVDLHPVPSGHQGLDPLERGSAGRSCGADAVEAIAPEAGRAAAGGAVVAVAQPGQVDLYPAAAGGRPRVVRVPATARVTEAVAVSGTSGTGWFLERSGSGWSLLGVTTAGAIVGPRPLPGFGPGARPAPPVAAGGHLYTLDRAAGGQPLLWRIDPARAAVGPVPGIARYPAKTASEQATFAGATVTADGPRVVFNNPGSLLAVVVFTDGSHPPVAVDKSSALDVSATGPGIPGLAGTQAAPDAPPGKSPGTPNPAPAPAQAVSTQVTCATTTVKPYAPHITSVTPSAQTALVSWSYQLLDEQDCEPDTWTVALQALGGAPQPAHPVQEVTGQDQLQVSGLRPATTYSAVVAAYINRQSTPSQPVTFTTAARGPDAPTSVSTVSDGKGDWVISWTPCAPAACVVPADTWTVTGSACGGSYAGTPPSVQVAGSETSATIDASGLGLLGSSLSFTVSGQTAAGLSGDPASDHACTQAWRPPDASAIALHAAATPSGSTLTATLQVSTSGDPAQAFGTTSPQFVYSVGDRSVGPTSQTTVTVAGLAPGVSYTPTVTVYPSGHPQASVVVTGASFTETVPWPSLGLDASGAVDASNPNQGSVTANVSGLQPGSYTASGTLTCGSTSLNVGGPLSGSTLTVANIDLDSMGGACGLTLTLADSSNPNPYGVNSPPLAASLTLGSQPQYSFTAQYSKQCVLTFCATPQIEVDDNGPNPPPEGINWTVNATDHHHCSAANPYGPATNPPQFPVYLDWPCGNAKNADVTIGYEYLGQNVTLDLGSPSGTPATTTTTTSTTVPATTSTTAKSTTTTAKSTSTTKAGALGAASPPSVLAVSDRPAGPVGSDPAGGLTAEILAGAAVVVLVPASRRRRRRP